MIKSSEHVKKKIIRVALIGPESTAKSTICEWLADKLNTVWVKEYSREYLNHLNRNYTPEDIVKIYKKQFKIEESILPSANKIIFIDTEFINAQVWYESLQGKRHPWIENMIDNYAYDFYLLTKPDILWTPDPLRENPDKGDYFFNIYKEQLDLRNLTYKIVSGIGKTRLECALKHVIDYLKKN